MPPGAPPGGRPSRAPVLSQPLFSCVFSNPWVESTRLVVKPDQVIKRRGKAGLLLLNATWAEVQEWVNARIGREITVGGVCGPLTNFIVEPFLPHAASDEYYVCVQSHRFGEEVLFYHEVRPRVPPSPPTHVGLTRAAGGRDLVQGGVDIGDVDAKAVRLDVPIGSPLPSVDAVSLALLGGGNFPMSPPHTRCGLTTLMYWHDACVSACVLMCLPTAHRGWGGWFCSCA